MSFFLTLSSLRARSDACPSNSFCTQVRERTDGVGGEASLDTADCVELQNGWHFPLLPELQAYILYAPVSCFPRYTWPLPGAPSYPEFRANVLHTGCACCNASDELLQSISQLLRLANRRGTLYDRMIIELSGMCLYPYPCCCTHSRLAVCGSRLQRGTRGGSE